MTALHRWSARRLSTRQSS